MTQSRSIALIACLLSAACPALAQCLEWVNVTPAATGPEPRHGHAAAFDESRGRMVVFGGNAQGEAVLGDTWEWDGTDWVAFAPAATPTPRHGAAMCYDPFRKETVMFGGLVSSGVYSSQTWVWNGSSWALRTQAGPAPRHNAAMSFDTARGVAVMHGGYGYAGDLSDTWEWNGTTWVFRAAGPKQHGANDGGASMAFDPVRGTTILAVVRQEVNSYFPETWEWDGQSWTQVPNGSLPALVDSSMAFDPASGEMKIYAGYEPKSVGSLFRSEVWHFDPGNGWYEIPGAGYSLRRGHALVLDGANGRMLASGGVNNGGLLPDLSAFDLATGSWSIVSGPNLGKPARPYLAMDGVRGVVTMLALGGATWEWNGSSWRLASVLGPTRPIGLVEDADSGALVAPDLDAEVWEWNGYEWERIPEPPGGPVSLGYHHRAMFDEQFHELVVQGASLTWAWNGDVWQLWSKSGPTGSEGGLTYDSGRLVGVYFGGNAGTSVADDTWEWDGFFWTKRADTAPLPGRDGHALAFNPQRATSMVFGGRTSTSTPTALAPNDVWEWDGSGWTKAVPGGPSARLFPGMAFDTARDEMVLFGGTTATPVGLGDTWVLRNPTRFTIQPKDVSVKAGQQAKFLVQAVNTSVYTWRKDGQLISNGTKYTGANSTDLTVHDAQPEDAGIYTCVIADPCGSAVHSKGAALEVVPTDFALQTGFEPTAYGGSQSGTPLSGQQGWYNPGSGPGFDVFTYAAGVHGFTANPMGQQNLIVGRREGPNQTARAAYPIDVNDHGRWAFVGDVAARFDGTFPAQPDLGTLIAHPDVNARGFKAVLTWDDPQVCDAFSIHFEGYDVIGQPAVFDPGPAFKALKADHWYRIAVGIDYAKNSIRWVQIRDLHGGQRMTFFKVGWYMLGGFLPQGPRADTFWLAATGGTGAVSGEGNTVAWDNVAVRHDTFCDADCELDLDLDLFDFLCFQQKFVEQDPYADFEGDGDWDLFDYLTFQGSYAQGCE